MYKSILTATALVLAASAVPAAAYEGQHHRHKPSVGRTMTNSYVKHDAGRRTTYHVERHDSVRDHSEHRRWWWKRHHDDYAEHHEGHRRHWWRRWY